MKKHRIGYWISIIVFIAIIGVGVAWFLTANNGQNTTHESSENIVEKTPQTRNKENLTFLGEKELKEKIEKEKEEKKADETPEDKGQDENVNDGQKNDQETNTNDTKKPEKTRKENNKESGKSVDKGSSGKQTTDKTPKKVDKPKKESKPQKTEEPKKEEKPEENPKSSYVLKSRSHTGVENQVLKIVNQERADKGLAKLSASPQLAYLAKLKAEDMRDKGYFAHKSPTYGTTQTMVGKFGLSYSWIGENIATGQKDASTVMTAWMNSPGHRKNILRKEFTQIGIAHVTGGEHGTYWVQIFRRP